MYGPWSEPEIALALLQDAHRRGATVFDMSGGAQLRDFLAVEVLGGTDRFDGA